MLKLIKFYNTLIPHFKNCKYNIIEKTKVLLFKFIGKNIFVIKIKTIESKIFYYLLSQQNTKTNIMDIYIHFHYVHYILLYLYYC